MQGISIYGKFYTCELDAYKYTSFLTGLWRSAPYLSLCPHSSVKKYNRIQNMHKMDVICYMEKVKFKQWDCCQIGTECY